MILVKNTKKEAVEAMQILPQPNLFGYRETGGFSYGFSLKNQLN